jgi:hypothetical protein
MSDCGFASSLHEWNQTLCQNRPVFSAKTVNLVDTQSIAFISELELNTVGGFSDPSSYLIYGATQKIKAYSAPQELALCGPLPVGIPPTPEFAGNEYSAYILPFGGDIASGGTMTIVWPPPAPNAAGTVTQVYITGHEVSIDELNGKVGTVLPQQPLQKTWTVVRDGAAPSQEVTLGLSGFRAGVSPSILLHFIVPVAP